MPWRSVVTMEERIRFIGDYLNGVFSLDLSREIFTPLNACPMKCKAYFIGAKHI
jgi:hypothetical protein